MKSGLNLGILFFFFLIHLKAHASDEVCRFNYISFDQKHLSCLTKSPAINGIKSNFLKLKLTRQTCPKCVDIFPNASKYFHLYNRTFLALAMGEHDFGGYFAFVIFKNDPFMYSVWLYEIDKNIFQIREFKPEEPPAKIKGKMPDLARKQKFSKYWIKIEGG